MAKNKRPEFDLDAEAQAALVEARAMPQGPGRTAAIELLRCRKPVFFDMLPTHTESFMQSGGDPRKPGGGCRQRLEQEHDCRTLWYL